MVKKKQKKSKNPKPERVRAPALVHLVLCLIILIVTVGVYINTIHYPFQFDDLHRIRDNQNIRSFSSLCSEYRFFNGERSVVNFTLWMNYKLCKRTDAGAPTVEGMHVFNILIHAFNGILVYFLAAIILQRYFEIINERKRNSPPSNAEPTSLLLRNRAPILAMFTGLIFTLHPVQTESVTYLITRSEILATFFCLAAMLLYIRLVPSRSMTHFIITIVGILVCYALALESKEWAPALPLLMLLVDYFFLSGINGRKFRKRLDLTGTAIFLMLLMTGIYLHNLNATYKGDLDAGFGVTGITHGQYFLSQFNVVAHYVKLIFVPTGLRLDYDFPIVTSPLHYPTYLTLPFVIILLVTAILIVRRAPIFSFAFLWFFIAIAPSSGVIPIADLIYEHRLYIAMVGIALAAVYFIWRLFQQKDKTGISYGACALLVLLVGACAFGTVSRNRIWSSVEALWKDSVEKSPNKARPHANLGLRYLRMFREGQGSTELLDKAEHHLARATQLEPGHPEAFHNLGVVFVAKAENGISPKENLEKSRVNYRNHIKIIEARIEDVDKKISEEAKYDEDLEKALEEVKSSFSRKIGKAYHDLGVSYEHNDKGVRYGKGFDAVNTLAAYDSCIEHCPTNTDSLMNKAIVNIEIGKPNEGAQLLKTLFDLIKNPEEQTKIVIGTYNKGIIEAQKGNRHLAENYLQAAIKLAPDHEKAGPAREYIRGGARN